MQSLGLWQSCGQFSFMLLKDYWFKQFYLGLKVAASLDRTESFSKTIEGQVRCITAGVKVTWNVSYINVFIPAWMVPPVYHSLRREEIKCRNSRTAMGVKSLHPTWFEDETEPKLLQEPCMDYASSSRRTSCP